LQQTLAAMGNGEIVTWGVCGEGTTNTPSCRSSLAVFLYFFLFLQRMQRFSCHFLSIRGDEVIDCPSSLLAIPVALCFCFSQLFFFAGDLIFVLPCFRWKTGFAFSSLPCQMLTMLVVWCSFLSFSLFFRPQIGRDSWPNLAHKVITSAGSCLVTIRA